MSAEPIHADDYEARFSARISIRSRQRKLVLKHRHNVREIDAVFGEVRAILCGVPCVLHAQLYVQTCTDARDAREGDIKLARRIPSTTLRIDAERP